MEVGMIWMISFLKDLFFKLARKICALGCAMKPFAFKIFKNL